MRCTWCGICAFCGSEPCRCEEEAAEAAADARESDRIMAEIEATPIEVIESELREAGCDTDNLTKQTRTVVRLSLERNKAVRERDAMRMRAEAAESERDRLRNALIDVAVDSFKRDTVEPPTDHELMRRGLTERGVASYRRLMADRAVAVAPVNEEACSRCRVNEDGGLVQCPRHEQPL